MTATTAPRSGSQGGPSAWLVAASWAVAAPGLILAAYHLPPLVTAGLLALVVAVSVLLRSQYDATSLLLVVLMLAAIVPAPLVVGPLGSVGSPVVLCGLVMMGLWAIHVVNSVWSPVLRPVPVLVLAFALTHLASYASASLRPIDAVELRAADRGLITIVAAVGVALFTSELVVSRARLHTLVAGIVTAAAIIAAIGVVQFFTGYDLPAQIHVPGLSTSGEPLQFISERSMFRRVAGPTLHPIEFSAVLCISLPLGLHLAMHHSRRWLTAVALIAMAIPMSVSRTGIVGLAALLLTLLPTWPQQLRRRALVGIAFYAVAMRLLIPGLLGTMRALFVDAGNDPSVTTRQMDYDNLGRFIAENLFLGRGFATFIPSRYDFLDNQYLLSLVEVGLVGVFALVSLLVGAMVVAALTRRRTTDVRDRDLAQSLLASLVVVAVTCATFDFLSFPTGRLLLFVIVGAVGAMARLAPDEAPPAGADHLITAAAASSGEPPEHGR